MKNKLNIFIDVSSLRQENLSGVGNYLKNLLSNIFLLDQENNYYLYSFGYKNVPIQFDFSEFKNVSYKNIKLANKFIFLTNYFFSWPKIDILKYDNKKIKADIILLPNFGICSLKNKKTKLITTIHDLSFVKYKEFLNLKRKFWHYFLKIKKIIKRSNAIICVSDNTALDLQKKYKVNPTKILVSYLGIDKIYSKIEDKERLETIKQKYNLLDNFLLFVGTKEPRKNMISILKSFEALSKEFDDLNLVICGESGWKEKQYKKILNSFDKSVIDKIKLLNYVPEIDLPAIYNLAKIFLWPSYYEGFGLPPLEAIACNCPTITSNNSSMPEVLKNNALLIESFDINDLYTAIKLMLQDKSLYNYYKEKHISDVYYNNWQNLAQKIFNLFNKI